MSETASASDSTQSSGTEVIVYYAEMGMRTQSGETNNFSLDIKDVFIKEEKNARLIPVLGHVLMCSALV